jgi:hypothetical protein
VSIGVVAAGGGVSRSLGRGLKYVRYGLNGHLCLPVSAAPSASAACANQAIRSLLSCDSSNWPIWRSCRLARPPWLRI